MLYFQTITVGKSTAGLTLSPHTTLHAAPHRAFPKDVLKQEAGRLAPA